MAPSSCTEQTAKKYTERNSPPYPANTCPVGDKKMGNDGRMYVVSEPNKKGVSRWVLEAPKKKVAKKVVKKVVAKKAAPAPSAVQSPQKIPEKPKRVYKPKEKKPCKSDQVRNPETGRCRKVKPEPVKKVKALKAAKKASTPSVCKTGLKTVTIDDMRADKMYTKTFCPVFSEPSGKKWIFYDEDNEEFRKPFFPISAGGYGSNAYMTEKQVDTVLKNKYTVWYVESIPEFYYDT